MEETGVIPSDKIPDEIGISDTLPPPATEITPADYEQPTADPTKLAGMKVEDLTEQHEAPTEVTPELEADIEKAGAPKYSEKQFLQDNGIEGYESVADYKAAQDSALNQLKATAKAAGTDLSEAQNFGEAVRVLENQVLEARRNNQQYGAEGPSPLPQQASGNLDQLMQRHENDEIGMKFTPELRKFYGDFAQAVQAPVQAQVAQMQRAAKLMMVNAWYSRATTSTGDDPIPSFQEAYNLMELRPDLAQRAFDRMETFGDVSQNPMEAIFDQWRATRTPSGLTKGETKRRDADARKLADLKKLQRAKPQRSKAKGNVVADMQSILANKSLDDLG